MFDVDNETVEKAYEELLIEFAKIGTKYKLNAHGMLLVGNKIAKAGEKVFFETAIEHIKKTKNN